MMHPANVELVADARCQIAEGPVWHPDDQCLYWTDIPAGRIHRFDPASRNHHCIYEGPVVGGIAIHENGDLVLVGEKGRVSICRRGRIIGNVVDTLPDELDTRFNDLIIDPVGRVMSGTMAQRDARGEITRHGNLYQIDTDGTPTRLADEMASPNGMGFTPDLSRVYVTDSWFGIQAIFRHDFDSETGSLSNRRLFHQAPLDLSDGRPDGMTVDADGYVWSARWDGGVVVRLAPDGTESARFPIPVRKVTSVAFGGPELTDLYVTTARGDVDEPGAGGVFRLPAVGQGRPEFRARLKIATEPPVDLQGVSTTNE